MKETMKTTGRRPGRGERRRTERQPFAGPICFDRTVRDDQGGLRCRATAVDIHASGVGLITEQAVQPADVLKVYLPVAGAPIALPVFSEVLWVRTAESLFHLGLRFLS
jgi:hypothetical protein